MTLAAIAGLCISAAVICRIFDKTNREYGVFISAAAAVIITAVVVGLLSPLVDFIDSMFEKAGADSAYADILYKSLGVTYLTDTAAGICRDSGESGLAARTETAGRITLAVMALPLFSEIVSLTDKLLP